MTGCPHQKAKPLWENYHVDSGNKIKKKNHLIQVPRTKKNHRIFNFGKKIAFILNASSRSNKKRKKKTKNSFFFSFKGRNKN